MAMSVTYTNFCGQLVQENRTGTQSFYVADTLGSTAALIGATGTVTDTWTYWPYGEVQSRTGGTATPFTFVGVLGYFQDLLNNLTYVRARFMRVAMGAWQTLDPIWPKTYGYVYCDLSPIFHTDEFGLQSDDDCKALWKAILKACAKKCKGEADPLKCMVACVDNAEKTYTVCCKMGIMDRCWTCDRKPCDPCMMGTDKLDCYACCGLQYDYCMKTPGEEKCEQYRLPCTDKCDLKKYTCNSGGGVYA